MSEIRDYVVTQTRTVSIRANTATDAVKIAQSAFEHGLQSFHDLVVPVDDVWGNVASDIREDQIVVNRVG